LDVATINELKRLEAISAVALSGDGRFLESGSTDGTNCFWDISQAK